MRIVQIANQVQDLLALEDPAFREIQDLLAELAQILRATEGLVYPLEDLDPRFRDLFPGFEPADDLLKLCKGLLEGGSTGAGRFRGVVFGGHVMIVSLWHGAWSLRGPLHVSSRP